MTAELVVIIHFAFVVFVVCGGLLVLWRRWWAWLHLPAVLWGVLIEMGGWVCPLTYLENTLRQQTGTQTYSGDFVGQYLLPLLYPQELTRGMQWAFAASLVVVNLLVYWLALRRYRRLRN